MPWVNMFIQTRLPQLSDVHGEGSLAMLIPLDYKAENAELRMMACSLQFDSASATFLDFLHAQAEGRDYVSLLYFSGIGMGMNF